MEMSFYETIAICLIFLQIILLLVVPLHKYVAVYGINLLIAIGASFWVASYYDTNTEVVDNTPAVYIPGSPNYNFNRGDSVQVKESFLLQWFPVIAVSLAVIALIISLLTFLRVQQRVSVGKVITGEATIFNRPAPAPVQAPIQAKPAEVAVEKPNSGISEADEQELLKFCNRMGIPTKNRSMEALASEILDLSTDHMKENIPTDLPKILQAVCIAKANNY